MKDNESAPESLLVAIVDDDASMRNSTRRLIRSFFGFRAEAFASAREFLDSRCLTDAACLVLVCGCRAWTDWNYNVSSPTPTTGFPSFSSPRTLVEWPFNFRFFGFYQVFFGAVIASEATILQHRGLKKVNYSH
jgi:hypothetical protein